MSVFAGKALASSLATLWCVGLFIACAAQDTKPGGGVTQQSLESFDAGRFVRSHQIDNQWMPLKPGMRFVYEGTTIEDDGTAVPHRVVINVTDLTKMIGGVRTVVTWDLDYSDGELVEAEIAFFAQDSNGTVWRMGEYPEEYDDGKFVAAPAWLHGLEGASAGIMMHAKPQVGTPSYAEGWAPAVNWTDRGQVDQVAQKTCVPAACYEDVIVIAETSAGEVGAQQLKYYARGVRQRPRRLERRGRENERDAGADEGRAARRHGLGRDTRGRAGDGTERLSAQQDRVRAHAAGRMSA